MKIRVHPSDEHGSGLFRMREPARMAARLGHDVEVTNQLRPPHGEDVFVFQRVGSPQVVEAIPRLQRQGVAVVVDMDDDMTCLDVAHPSFHEFHSKYGKWSHRTMLKACGMADLVTVTSSALARRYAAHGRVAILPNCVQEKLLAMPRDSDGRTIGCSTNPINHPGDLEVVGAGVSMALEQTGAHLECVGAPDEAVEAVRGGLGVPHDKFHSHGVQRFDDYWLTLGRFDVGIAPLRDTAFNSGKSFLKPLEFMARGVAWVGSPRAEYAWLHQEDEVGFMATDRTRSWRSALVRLLNDEALRNEQSERGMVRVAERHTIEGQAWQWLEAWERAMDFHAARRGVLAA